MNRTVYAYLFFFNFANGRESLIRIGVRMWLRIINCIRCDVILNVLDMLTNLVHLQENLCYTPCANVSFGRKHRLHENILSI